MFTDSHCHLTFPELRQSWPHIQQAMIEQRVTRALVIATTLEDFPEVHALACAHAGLWCSVGVHPDNEGVTEPSVADLVRLSAEPKVVAIGETGLDYYQMQERKGGRTIADMDWQRERFRTHIRAAQQVGKPLIIHTRAASEDTIAILKEEGEGGAGGQNRGQAVGGVFHCFTESMAVSRAALDMGFYISFSGILTFKSAAELREVAAWMPLDKLLIETDSPYLAPAPHRGKINNPSYVPLVAQQIAQLRGVSTEEIGRISTENFMRLFKLTSDVDVLSEAIAS